MSAKQARDNFTDLLGAVYYGQETVIVEKKGRPFAVVINPRTYQKLQKADAKDWEIIERIQARNKDKDPDEVLADVTEEVEAVRQELYEKEQKKKASRRH